MSHVTILIFTDWLKDIGLPQYRDIFIDGLVDGNMLNELTYVCLGEAMVIISKIISFYHRMIYLCYK